jgi:hypothetical protein
MQMGGKMAASQGGRATSARFVPRGFSSADQFIQASGELRVALARSGITDAQVGLRGSSVTGFSSQTGAPFSALSDLDFFAESAQLTKGFSTSRNISGFVHPGKLLGTFPEIGAWSSRWSRILGHEVSLGGFTPGSLSGGTLPAPIIWIK